MIFEDNSKKILYGVYSPPIHAPCFTIPVFSDGHSFFVQSFDNDGRVKSFDTIIIKENIIHKIYSPIVAEVVHSIYAFWFSPDNILIGKEGEIQKLLKNRLYEIKKYPFALMDVAKFLGDTQLQENAAKAISNIMATGDEDQPKKWQYDHQENITEIDKVLDGLYKIVKFKKSSLQSVSNSGRNLLDSRGFPKENPNESLLSPIDNDPLLQEVFKANEVFIIPDTSKNKCWSPCYGTEDVRSWIGIPIKIYDSPKALITIDHDINWYFGRSLKKPLEQYAKSITSVVLEYLSDFRFGNIYTTFKSNQGNAVKKKLERKVSNTRL